MYARGLHVTGAGLAAFVVIAAASTFSMARPETASQGKELFDRRCGGCHALDRDKEGPRLRGVYGRLAGAVESFRYSEALKRSKITWAEDTLDKWLADPDALVADTDMSFHVDKTDERREIIEYLKQSSGK